MPLTAQEVQQLPKVFVDTQIFTCFRFLESPRLFQPQEGNPCNFIVTASVVHELERIKDEHFVSGQRARARGVLDCLEEADRIGGHPLDGGSVLTYRYSEPHENNMGYPMRVYGPDDRFVAAVANILRYDNPRSWVLSDDVGVRLRVKHILASEKCVPYAPRRDLRYAEEDFNLPQLVKAAVRELARELAQQLRE